MQSDQPMKASKPSNHCEPTKEAQTVFLSKVEEVRGRCQHKNAGHENRDADDGQLGRGDNWGKIISINCLLPEILQVSWLFSLVWDQTSESGTPWWISSQEPVSSIREVHLNTVSVFHLCPRCCHRVGRDCGAATGPVSVTSQLKMPDKPGAGWLICPTCLKSRTGPLSLLVLAMVSKRALVDWLSHSMLALLLVLSTCLLHISV